MSSSIFFFLAKKSWILKTLRFCSSISLSHVFTNFYSHVIKISVKQCWSSYWQINWKMLVTNCTNHNRQSFKYFFSEKFKAPIFVNTLLYTALKKTYWSKHERSPLYMSKKNIYIKCVVCEHLTNLLGQISAI